MKVIKKRIVVFILCFTLFTCGFVHTDPVQEVKASATVAALSFVILGLTAIGFNYYSQASVSSLQNDIEIYASEHNTTSASFLNAFQSVVVDVAKDAVKFTAAQVYLLKEFANSLLNKNKVSYVPITNSSFETVPLFGYPCLMKVHGGDSLSFVGEDGETYNILIDSTSIGDVYLGYCCDFANRYSDANGLCVSPNSGSVSFRVVFPSGAVNSYQMSGGNAQRLVFGDLDTYFSSSNPFVYLTVNGKHIYNCYYTEDHVNYPTIYNYSKFVEQCRLRFGFDSANSTYSGVVLPSYSVDKTVFDNIASDKDLVITSPDVIDKAVDNAIVRNPSATSVTADDVAAAIDGTAVGVIDPAAEDEEDRVIAPPISLDDDLAISQDSAITDTVVEDLDIGDPVPPPDPPPVIPEIDSALAAKFPFSIFSDFILIMSIFDEEPEAPVFNLGFTALGRDFQFTIDLSAFDSVASVVRTMELLAFIVGIIFVTIKFMQGGSD